MDPLLRHDSDGVGQAYGLFMKRAVQLSGRQLLASLLGRGATRQPRQLSALASLTVQAAQLQLDVDTGRMLCDRSQVRYEFATEQALARPHRNAAA